MLFTAIGGYARDVQIHFTDQRGTPLPDMRIDFLGDILYTDSEGNFTITGLTGGGTYSFTYDKDYSQETVSFDWDGGTPTVDVRAKGYFITLLLDGLSEAEMELYGNSQQCTLTGGDNRYGYFSSGKLSLWWNNSTLEWSLLYNPYWGEAKGVVDLDATTGNIVINPVRGKRRLTIGSVIGHDGLPIQGVRIEGLDKEDLPGKTFTFWRTPGENYLSFSADGYLSHTFTCTVGDEDTVVDIDLSDCLSAEFNVKDRDGKPMAGVEVLFPTGDVIGKTGDDGSCTAYYPSSFVGDWYYCRIDPDELFYPEQSYEFRLGTEGTSVTMSYEGYKLVNARIIGGSRFITSHESWDGTVTWWQNAEVYLRCPSEYETDGYQEIHFYTLEYERQGEDILVGMLVDNRDGQWTEARMNLSFLNSEPRLLPVQGEYASLENDVYMEYDVTNHKAVTLSAPEGFTLSGNNIKVDGMEVYKGWNNNSSVVLYMPEGEHEWMPALYNEMEGQTYPYGKAQAFTSGEDDLLVVYPFNIDDYHGIRFAVTDQNGLPLNGLSVAVYDSSGYTQLGSAYTNEEGKAAVFLSEPGTYKWYSDYYHSRGFSLQGTVEVGESMVDLPVSYAGWHVLSLKVSGDNLSTTSGVWCNLRMETGNASATLTCYGYDGTVYDYYFKDYLIPSGTLQGSFEVTHARGMRATVPFVLEIDDRDVSYSLDTDTLYVVDFTVNGVDFLESFYGEQINVYRNNTSLRNNSPSVWLNAGKYYAIYSNSNLGYKDTLYFDVTDHDMVLDFKYNVDDFHSVNVTCVNALEEIEHVFYEVDGDDPQRKFLKGTTHHYMIYALQTKNFGRVQTDIIGSFKVEDEDVNVQVDLSSYRFFYPVLRMADGSDWISYDYYMTFESLDGNTVVTCWGEYGYEEALTMPAGTYKVKVRDYDTSEYVYGTLVVPADCPETLTIVLSDEPDAIESVRSDGNEELSATLYAGELHVDAPAGEPVVVCIYGMNGKMLLDTQVAPGASVPVGHLGKGVYILQMRQGSAVRTCKFIL